jgi:hypothetical protein
MLAVALVANLLLLGRTPAPYVASATLLYLVAHSHFGRSGVVADVGRLCGLLVLLLAVVRFPKENRATRIAPQAGLWVVAGCGAVCYGSVIVTHGMDATVGLAAATFGLVCIVLLLLSTKGYAEPFRVGLEAALLSALSLCLLWALIRPSEAFAGVRLEGVFRNANTLGFFGACGLLLSLSAPLGTRGKALLGVSVLCLVAAGSRSAALAAALALVLGGTHALAHRGSKRLLYAALWVGLLCGGALFVVNRSQTQLLRGGDSRTSGSEYARAVSEQFPWSGVGYQKSVIEVASTPLRWLAEGGYIPFSAIVLAYLAMIVVGWRGGTTVFAFAVFGIVSSVFEGWYVAGGSGLFVVYWLALISAANSSNSVHPQAANPSAIPRVRPAGGKRGRPPGHLPDVRPLVPRMGRR